MRPSMHRPDFSWQPSTDLMATSTHLQLRRNERGEALLLTISIIGFAIIVTVAAFLLSASLAQDTERLASAKVDIATREDPLKRAVLLHTATGIFPAIVSIGAGINWSSFMTSAVKLLDHTSD